MATRRSRWSGETPQTHLGLLDDDLDVVEGKLDAIQKILIGILVSTTTAALIGIVNIVNH